MNHEFIEYIYRVSKSKIGMLEKPYEKMKIKSDAMHAYYNDPVFHAMVRIGTDLIEKNMELKHDN